MDDSDTDVEAKSVSTEETVTVAKVVPRDHKALDKFRKAGKSVMLGLGVVAEMRRRTFPYANAEGEVTLKKKLIYAAPSFSLLSLTMLITIHAILFYESLGADLAIMSFYTAIARSFDVITDPLMGWVSDSTRTRWGRRKPYITTASWGYAFAFLAFMSPPSSLGTRGTENWFGLWYIVFYLFDTVANVPYQAWGPELTDSPVERESVFFWRGLVDKIGVLAGAAGPAVVGAIFGTGDRDTYTILALMFGAYYCASMTVLVTSLKERKKSLETDPVPLVPSILRAFKNMAFRPLLFAWILDYVALGMISSMFPFYVKYIVIDDPTKDDESDTVLGITLGLLFVSAGLAMPVWKKLSLRYGKRKVWLAYNVYNTLSNFFFIAVGKDDYTLLYILAVVNGIPVGGQFLIEAILSDVIDYDEFLNGTRNEGSFTVFATFIPKVVSIPSSAIPLAVLSAAGFKKSINEVSQPQDDTTKNALRIMFVLIPSIATFFSLLLKMTYPIKNAAMIQAISQGIIKHEAHQVADDPVTGAHKVDVLRLRPEEQEVAWLLDNFSWRELVKYARGEKMHLVEEMRVYIGLGIAFLSGFALMIGVTYQRGFLEDDTYAWIPIFGCIASGMSLCFIVVNVLRLKSAQALLEHKVERDLALRIIAHKRRGQRGGDVLSREELENLNGPDAEKDPTQHPSPTAQFITATSTTEMIKIDKHASDEE